MNLPGAALAQPVEHRIRNAEVTCSSHVSGTILLIKHMILNKNIRNIYCSPLHSPLVVLRWIDPPFAFEAFLIMDDLYSDLSV